MNRMREIYCAAKADKWFQRFTIFCRFALAASFLPAGLVKIMGHRFAEGLPHNNPLGHYFDALLQTGYYYTFIGLVQVITAILLMIPRTALLGALMYFCMIINIGVLTYATRFNGTRIVTMMVLACLYLLIWDYDRLRIILSLKQREPTHQIVKKPLGIRLRILFFGSCIGLLAFIIIGTSYLYEIVPGNAEAECWNQCRGKNAEACRVFCDCIYNQGQPLDSCLATYNEMKEKR